ncbi:hypothetical protein ACWIUD_01735 [Helicobacter sp. 23-1044]
MRIFSARYGGFLDCHDLTSSNLAMTANIADSANYIRFCEFRARFCGVLRHFLFKILR